MQQVLLPPSAPAGDSEAYIPPVPIAAAIGTQVELPPPTIPVPSPVAAATGNQVELPPPTIPDSFNPENLPAGKIDIFSYKYIFLSSNIFF